MSIPRALYWTLNQGSSAKHQLYRAVAVEDSRKGLKYIISRSPFFMVCLPLVLMPLLISKAADATGNGGSAKSRPSAAGRTSAVDCLNLTVVYVCLSTSAAPSVLLFLETEGRSSNAAAGLFRDIEEQVQETQLLLRACTLIRAQTRKHCSSEEPNQPVFVPTERG